MASDRAGDSSAGRDRIVSECEDEHGRKTGEHARPLEEQRAVLGSAWRTEDGANRDQHGTDLRLFCVLQDIRTFQAVDTTVQKDSMLI
ncbi:hypothetical protein VZT92_001944 [Zoarces viviparus]|uniref:Uncharacterized protein n=1 Tax=Zoarces viviparus TaxID=48416 RepID=A0AAW1G564_ZOAVI